MKLLTELIHDILDKETELQKTYGGKIKSIFINFNVFDKLMDDKEIIGKLLVNENGYRFCGIPIVRGNTVDKWELQCD